MAGHEWLRGVMGGYTKRNALDHWIFWIYKLVQRARATQNSLVLAEGGLVLRKNFGYSIQPSIQDLI